MDSVHPLGSLAPRDIVARGIHHVLRETGDEHVILDVTAISPQRFAERFPSTLEGCAERGIDPHRDGIPVVPAAHYQCGGVWTDHHGATSLAGLFATGEVACTGLHGANRLASNSLLEAVVYSHRAAGAVVARLDSVGDLRGSVDQLDLPEAPHPALEPEPPVDPAREGLRDLLWEHAGIERRWDELNAHHADILERIEEEEERFRTADPLRASEVERRNLHWVGLLILESALARCESRGLHYLADRPFRNNEWGLHDTVLVRGAAAFSPTCGPGGHR
jgi:L-aspartate oxidase